MMIKYKRIVSIFITIFVMNYLVKATVLSNYKIDLNNLTLNNIKSCEVLPGGPSTAHFKGYYFNLNNPNHRKIIINMINEIKLGKIETNDIGITGYNSFYPIQIRIVMKNHTVYLLTSTVGGKLKSCSDGGTTVIRFNVKNQVTIDYFVGNKVQTIRKDCPITKKLIEGWKKVFNK